MIILKPLRHTKTKILIVCLLQGIFSLSIALYSLTDIPEVLDVEIVKVNAKPEVRRKNVNKTKTLTITRTFTSEEGETFILFRFDRIVKRLRRDIWRDAKRWDEKYPYFSHGYRQEEIPEWFNVKDAYCGGSLVFHGKRLGYLRNATVNPDLVSGNVGGEEFENIIHQPLEAEYLKFEKGFFRIASDQPLRVQPNYTLNVELQCFLNALQVVPRSMNDFIETDRSRDKMAIMVTRHEYANFYHSTMNWYDTFLIMVMFNVQPAGIEMFWADAHPKSTLDGVWDTLYGKCKRIRELGRLLTYDQVVWNGIGERSLVNAHKAEDLPFINEYRHFVLSRYGIKPRHNIDCTQLRVTIIWRRSYIAHPRNPDGFIPRQIYNENDVLKAISDTLPAAHADGVQLDGLTMSEQLRLVTSTDILIGMHGAGLSHILYLPGTSGVIELFTRRTSIGNAHFRSMAKWRRLPYIVWINSNANYEMRDHRTKVPIETLKEMVRTMQSVLCETGKL